MIEMKTTDLTGTALDWAVAVSEGATNLYFDTVSCWWFTLNGADRVLSSGWSEKQNYCPSTDWRYGGPLIEQHRIATAMVDDSEPVLWRGQLSDPFRALPSVQSHIGPTPLIAAMRCLVASKLGDTVQIPSELIQ